MDIIKIYIDKNFNLIFNIHWVVYAIAVLMVLYWIFKILKSKRFLFKNIEIDSAEIGIQGQKIKIKPNYTNIGIAYKIWVELNTRKIGLKIDFENDVITEVYDSWYEFFGLTRNLIKGIPASKIRKDNDTIELIELSTRVLNEGLRPHMTVWQAKYRKWYDFACSQDSNKTKSPQLIQQGYPEYDLLKSDMMTINQNLINYKKSIYKLAFGKDDISNLS